MIKMKTQKRPRISLQESGVTLTIIISLINKLQHIHVYVAVNLFLLLFQLSFNFPLFQIHYQHYHSQKQWKNKNYLR